MVESSVESEAAVAKEEEEDVALRFLHWMEVRTPSLERVALQKALVFQPTAWFGAESVQRPA